MAEELKVSMVLDTRQYDSKVKQKQSQIKQVRKNLESQTVIRMRANVARLEQGIRLARKKLAAFQKAGNRQAEISARIRIGKFSEQLKTARKGLKDFQSQTSKVRKGFFSLNGIIRDGVKAFAGFVGIRAVINFFGALNKEAIEFEKTMANVATLIQGDSTQAIVGFRKEIIELTKSLPKNVNDLGAGLYQVLSAGVTDSADAMNVLEVSAKAAVAGLTETNTAVDAITTVLNAYNLNADEAGKVSDIFFTTIREGKTTFPELAGSIGKVATSASLAGVGFDELGAAFATMTKSGISTEETATALNRLLLQMVNPSKGLAKAAKKMGVEFGVANVRAKGFAGILQELTDLTEKDRDALFKLGLDIRSFKAAAILAGTGAEEFARQLDNTANALGAAEEAFDKANNTFDSRSKVFRQQISAVYLKFAETVLPKLTAALDFLVKDGGKNLSAILKVLKNLGKTLIVVFTVSTISRWVKSLRLGAASAVTSLNGVNRAAASIPRQIAISVALIGATAVLAGLDFIIDKIDEANQRSATLAEQSERRNQRSLRVQKKLSEFQEQEAKIISGLQDDLIRTEEQLLPLRQKEEKAFGATKEQLAEIVRLEGQRVAINEDIATRSSRLSDEAAKALKQVDKDFENVDNRTTEFNKNLNETDDVMGSIGGSAEQSKDAIKSMQDAVKDFNKEIDTTNKKSKDLRDDLTDFFGDIEESIEEAREAQEELTESFAEGIAKRDVDLADDELKIREDLKDERAEEEKDIERITELNEKLNKILEERKQIEAIAAGEGGIQEAIEEAERRAGLTETQKLEEDFKRAQELEQRKIDIQNQFLELQTRNDAKAISARRKLDQIAKGQRAADEEEINRILAEAGIENLSREEQQLFLSQQQRALALENELNAVVNQQQRILDAKQEFINLAEQAFNESVDRQIEKVNDLIRKIQAAKIEQSRLASATGVRPASNITTNTSNVNVNQNISSGVDFQSATRALINKINN